MESKTPPMYYNLAEDQSPSTEGSIRKLKIPHASTLISRLNSNISAPRMLSLLPNNKNFDN